MSTIRVKVVDSTFSHNPAIGFAGERVGETPQCFQWDTIPGDAPIKVFTDIRLKEALDDNSPKKIALLLECPAVNSDMYRWIIEHKDVFDAVLTHQWLLVSQGSPFQFYPFGGSWIREWGVFPKSKMVSMLVSDKRLTSAHRMRHEAAKLPNVSSYGNGVGRHVESKAEALRDYRFAIVIENEVSNWWFTEKLIDALSQGTIPIYRGCPDISRFFNTDGMLCWWTMDELKKILSGLTVQEYNRRLPAVYDNLQRARQYQCAEDWICEHYEDLLW